MFHRPITADLRLALAVPPMAGRIFALVEANRARFERWMPWVDGTSEIGHVQAFIVHSLNELAQGTGVHAAIQVQGETVGMVGCGRSAADPTLTEAGYWIDAAYEGRGLVGQAAAELLRLSRDELGLGRFLIRTVVGNVRSEAVANRLGFTHRSTCRDAVICHGQSVDMKEWILDGQNHVAGSRASA